jgi:hypothetical protein
VAADWDHVEYSNRTEDLISSFFEMPNPSQQAAVDALAVDDADEVHLGFEYLWRTCPAGRDANGECSGREVPIALRAGSWLDPDHRTIYDEPVGTDPNSRSQATQFPDIGDDEIHYSGGLGFVFGAFQIDAAIDFSELVDTAALSFVFSF